MDATQYKNKDTGSVSDKRSLGVLIERLLPTKAPPISRVVVRCRHAQAWVGDRLEIAAYHPLEPDVTNKVAIDMFGQVGRQRVVISLDDIIVLIGALEELRDQIS